MTMQILHRLVDEDLSGDRPTNKIRMLYIETSVGHGYFYTRTAA